CLGKRDIARLDTIGQTWDGPTALQRLYHERPPRARAPHPSSAGCPPKPQPARPARAVVPCRSVSVLSWISITRNTSYRFNHSWMTREDWDAVSCDGRVPQKSDESNMARVEAGHRFLPTQGRRSNAGSSQRFSEKSEETAQSGRC